MGELSGWVSAIITGVGLPDPISHSSSHSSCDDKSHKDHSGHSSSHDKSKSQDDDSSWDPPSSDDDDDD